MAYYHIALALPSHILDEIERLCYLAGSRLHQPILLRCCLLALRKETKMEMDDDNLSRFAAEGATPLPTTPDQGYVEHDGARIWYAA